MRIIKCWINRNPGLVAILLVFLALGVIYSVTTPLFESYDEAWHFAVIRHIAQGKGLPVLEPGKETLWRQEGGQPPFYYLVAASLTFWINSDDLESLLRHNPYFPYYRGPRNDNRNAFLHIDKERFPYTGTVLAVHLARAFSVFLGAVTVLATYLLARRIFPSEKILLLGATALVAFNPKFLFLSGTVSNDNMVTTLSTLTLLGLIYLVQGEESKRTLFGLGSVLGLAILSKLSALALLPLVFLVLAFVAWRRRYWTLLLRWASIVFGMAVLVAGWWYLRNLILYGDLMGLQTFMETSGWYRSQSPSIQEVLHSLQPVELSFWATFGLGHVLADEVVYDILKLLARLAGVGLVILGIRQFSRDRLPFINQISLGVLILWTIMISIAMLRYVQITSYREGRLVLPAIASIGIILLLGLAQWVPQRFRGVLASGVITGMFFLAAITPFRYIATAYARPPILDNIDETAIPHRVHVRYEDKVELIGYELPQRKIRPGEELRLTLYWRALAATEKDYSVYIHLRAQDGQLLGQRDTHPGLGNYPTSLWKPGQVIVDTYWVPVMASPTGSPIGHIDVGFYSLATMKPLPSFDPGGRAVVPVIGFFKVAGSPPSQGAVPNPTLLNLGGDIALRGYELPLRDLQPGQPLRFTLYWSALRSLERDYTVFVHLVDPGGHLWAQGDGWPQRGAYPTSFWDAGEIIRDEREVRLPAEIPPGEYQIEVGIYFLPTGERLPLLGEEGRRLDDKIRLGRVRVREM